MLYGHECTSVSDDFARFGARVIGFITICILKALWDRFNDQGRARWDD